MSPNEAIKLPSFKSKLSTPYDRLVGDNEQLLPLSTKVRDLYDPGEAEGDKRQRAADPNWSVTIHKIERILTTPNQPALYYITDGKRGYVHEEHQAFLLEKSHY